MYRILYFTISDLCKKLFLKAENGRERSDYRQDEKVHD